MYGLYSIEIDGMKLYSKDALELLRIAMIRELSGVKSVVRYPDGSIMYSTGLGYLKEEGE